MIQGSGCKGGSGLAISAAAVLACSTLVLSSVSGIVKNCGAWGSIAPPITVDIMVVLLVHAKISLKPRNNKLNPATATDRRRRMAWVRLHKQGRRHYGSSSFVHHDRA